MIKVVFIDWYKTLSSSTFWQQLKNTELQIYEKIQSAYLKDSGDQILTWMRGEYSAESFVNRISKTTIINFNFLLKELEKSAEYMQFDSKEFMPLIQNIRQKGIKVVIATDNMDTFDRWTVPAMNLKNYFDEILNSHYIKALKNDIGDHNRSLFFYDFLQKENIDISESLLIDYGIPSNIVNKGLNLYQIKSTEDVLKGLRSVLGQ